jgi:hypothetical protein
MKTAALAAAMMLVSNNALAADCSGPYCPPDPYPPPPAFITKVCSAVADQLNKTFTGAEEASNSDLSLSTCCGSIALPEGWCALNEWHDGSFSIALKSQSIGKSLRRTNYGYGSLVTLFGFTLDAAIDCFFDSTYEWRCGYQYSVFEFDQTYDDAARWAAMVLSRDRAIENACWVLPQPASGNCYRDGWRRALSDLEPILVPQLESDLLPAVNQVANSMLR